MNTAVIVPTNRPERIQRFVETWQFQFRRDGVRLIVVEDAPEWVVHLPDWVEHYCHADIIADLGTKAECIPTRSGGCRDYGFYRAWQDTSIDMVVSLDDDVLPLEDVNFIDEHWKALETPRNPKWWSLFPSFHVRGEPYYADMAKPMLNLGLWRGFPDVDAYRQLLDPDCEQTFSSYAITSNSMIPSGVGFACCGMNWACRREVVPFMYFPVLPEGMKRFDDIWAGLIFKRVADLYGWVVSYGTPLLLHERASNPLANLRQEMLGYGVNEDLWKILDKSLHGVWLRDTKLNTYRILAQDIRRHFPQLTEVVRLMQMWASLFDERDTVVETAWEDSENTVTSNDRR